MIIDAHMHLPVNYFNPRAKRANLLCELERSGVVGAVVISDSVLKSDIGSMRGCMELFRDVPNILVVGGISLLIGYREQLGLLEYGTRIGCSSEKSIADMSRFFLTARNLLPFSR